MSKSWLLDPAGIVERIDNRRVCPLCENNSVIRSDTGYMQWYCKLHHRLNDGTETAETCRNFKRKSIE